MEEIEILQYIDYQKEKILALLFNPREVKKTIPAMSLPPASPDRVNPNVSMFFLLFHLTI